MKIECLSGPAEQNVNGRRYKFNLDESGRFVAEVNALPDIEVFLSVEHYQKVDDNLEEATSSADLEKQKAAIDAAVEVARAELKAKHSAEMEALTLDHAKELKAQNDAYALQLKQLTTEHADALQKAKEEARAETLELLATDAGEKTETPEDATDQAQKTQKKASK